MSQSTKMADDGILLCLLCEKLMPADPTKRCVTDCSHEFCLSCLCRELAARKNRCPACHVVVKQVHQLLEMSPSSSPESQRMAPAPASIRYCNTTYTLNVSIWDVADPVRVLAGLFDLEHARLIHRGKLLKKGDVWPGSVVQLFGTRKGALQASTASGGYLASWITKEWLQRAQRVLCCPFSVLYDFVCSLFGNGEQQQRGYTRVAAGDVQGTTSSAFYEPGRVPSPEHTESF